jgi:hypothetical protein
MAWPSGFILMIGLSSYPVKALSAGTGDEKFSFEQVT